MKSFNVTYTIWLSKGFLSQYEKKWMTVNAEEGADAIQKVYRILNARGYVGKDLIMGHATEC